MNEAIVITIIIALTIIATPAIHFGLKARTKKEENNSPTFGKPEPIPNQNGSAPTFTPASQVGNQSNWERIDVVFGKVTVDGTEYTTYDAGEVYIHDKDGKKVIAFKVDGYGNEERTINYVRISEDLDKVNGVIYYIKHHAPTDYPLLEQWLNSQMYGGKYSREALEYKDCMVEIAKFNQLLASRKLRKSLGSYVVR